MFSEFQQTPLIENEQVTFLWFGETAPQLVGDFNHWNEEDPIELELQKPGVWAYKTEFPADAYIEYAFIRGKTREYDPFNPHTVYNGVSGENHYFYMPKGGPTPLAGFKPGTARGKITHVDLQNSFFLAGVERALDLYCPPVEGSVPLVLVFDGQDYWLRGSLPLIVDNLIAAGRIRPVALAMLHSGGQARGVEYACNDAKVGLVVNEVLPATFQHLDLVDINEEPGAFAVMGASMGGLISLYTALRLPHLFGKVLSQSGAFFPEAVVYDLLKLIDPRALKIWMDVGMYEFLLPENRRMAELMRNRGFNLTYREYPGGHNYSSWRDEVWRGLESLFPPVS